MNDQAIAALKALIAALEVSSEVVTCTFETSIGHPTGITYDGASPAFNQRVKFEIEYRLDANRGLV